MKQSILNSVTVLFIFVCTASFEGAYGQDAVVNTSTVSFNTRLGKMVNKGEKDILFFNVGTRFISSFSKEQLSHARSLADFMPKEEYSAIISFDSVSVILLDHNYNFVKIITGKDAKFNKEQLHLLESLPYSADLLIRADYQQTSPYSGKIEDNYTTPHLTIVPEKEAEFEYGKQALIDYVKNNTAHFETRVDPLNLQPGKVRFTISSSGEVKDVFLEATSGYESFDNAVMNLLSKIDGNWEPATNAKGDKVEQQLVFAFGIIGC